MLPLKNVCQCVHHSVARPPAHLARPWAGAVVWHATAGKLEVAPYQEDAVFYFYEWKLLFL